MLEPFRIISIRAGNNYGIFGAMFLSNSSVAIRHLNKYFCINHLLRIFAAHTKWIVSL